MFDWREVNVQQERYKDFLLEAERHRLIREIKPDREKGDHIHCRALTWLGHHLVTWGCFLERRYGIPADAPAVPAASQCR